VASVLTVGVVAGAWLVFASMFVFVFWKDVVAPHVAGGDRKPPLDTALGALFSAATAGALILLLAKAFGVETTALLRSPEAHLERAAWLALPLGFVFLVLQYTVVLTRYGLKGVNVSSMVRRVALPGMLLELTLTPVSIVLVFVYFADRGSFTGTLLLCLFYLVINLVMNWLSREQQKAELRATELEALERIGRSICSALETSDLVDRIGKEALGVFSEADRVVLHVWDDDKDGMLRYVFEAASGARRQPYPEAEGEQVLAHIKANRGVFHNLPLGRGKKARPAPRGLRPGIRGSWLGVPVAVYDQLLGVILLHRDSSARFDQDDARLVATVAQQAAVALQNAQLFRMATVDGLTQLFVRRYFDQRIAEEFERSAAMGPASPCSCSTSMTSRT
jgi:hypothetical protein